MAAATRAYAVDPVSGKVVCYRDPSDRQTLGVMVEAKRLTAFHDAELAQCTKEINAILNKTQQNNKDPARELAFLRTPEGIFLAWTVHGITGEEDAEVVKALGIV